MILFNREISRQLTAIMLQTSKSKINQDEIKINEVGKTFFEIQFDAKKKIISRLIDEINNFKKKTDKFKSKTNRLSIKLKDNYEYLKKILDEKNNLEKLLKAETAQLKQEVDSMEETSLSKLKKKDDEFIREAGKHKSITAIYVGRLNKLDEFTKQEKVLEQKYIYMKEQNVMMDKKYEIALKTMEENKFISEQIAKRNMLKRCVDFSVHMKKQSLMVKCPVEGASTNEILDLSEMVDIGNKQLEIYDKECLDLKKENKALKELLKSTREIINEKNVDDNSKENIEVKNLENKLANAKDLQGIQQVDKNTIRHVDRSIHLIVIEGTEAELKATDHDLHAIQVELYEIRSANQLLDRQIWKTEDALLNIYEKASVHLEEITSNTSNSKENIFDYIQKLYKELDDLITEDNKLLISDNVSND
ncbi:uncharacterized protein LOC114119616 isoform X2 [Aphis gossypii]|uniref:Uncharacterized protein n=1 Tax=Aphis gossypii TaxID=80765 RepID=A0A9P0NET9_APHGO|nr:uncharacterized protein LOC114119616 isoform X2 [Aphis gossypii]CAH1713992.1 unnamed protein product [Aphis gossypii]